MAGRDRRCCPVCTAAMDVIARYAIWRCADHGLVLDDQLKPHEQMREFPWRRNSGEISADRPAYRG
jgi:hypothetical protein